MDLHSQLILDEYRERLPAFRRLRDIVVPMLEDTIRECDMEVTSIGARIKTEHSLIGKLALKGNKYASVSDITDILGARIITYYTDDVDRIASMAEQIFNIDWENSVDKRKLHQLDSFGYNSLHYICRLKPTDDTPADIQGLCDLRFELQIRTTLQHAWASLNHDIGYKSGVEVPPEYLRRINRLAGLLELADDESSRIRTEINTYRHRVQSLVQSGKLEDIPLDGDTFKSYIQTHPFDALNSKIAAINQAELTEVPLITYLPVLKLLGCHTLGDVEKFKQQYAADAYWLARHQIGHTDLDILASSIGLQNLCIVAILTNGGGKISLKYFFDTVNGESDSNNLLAELTYNQAKDLPFVAK